MTTAEAMIACNDINAALAFYVDRLGFRVDSIFPADAPAVAVLRDAFSLSFVCTGPLAKMVPGMALAIDDYLAFVPAGAIRFTP